MIWKIEADSAGRVGATLHMLCICLSTLICGICPAAAQDPPRAERPLFETKIFTDGDYLLAPVQLHGKTYQFVIDTGAAVNAFDRSLREYLGPVLARGRLINEPEHEVEAVHPANVSIGRLAVDEDAQVLDLKRLKSVAGYEFHGIIGMEFLSQHIVAIDPDRGSFSLLESVPDDAGEKVEIRYMYCGRPFVANVVPGFEEEWFLLDTGSSGGNNGYVRDKFAESLLAAGIATRVPGLITSTGLFKDSPRKSIVLTRVAVGPFEHRSLLFRHHETLNVLALGMLLRYRIVLDFPNKTAYFKPSKFFDAPEKNDACGIRFRRIDGSVHIDSVRENSPASRAGIVPGDKIVSIGPHDGQTTRLHRLQMVLCEQGKTVPIVIQRGGQRLAFQIVLERSHSPADGAPRELYDVGERAEDGNSPQTLEPPGR